MSSLNGKTIYIYRDSYWVAEPVLGELHVLDSDETTLHNAGSTSEFREIHFWLLDPVDDYPSLTSAFRNASTITLVDWKSDSSSVKIRDMKILNHLMDIKRPTSNYVVSRISARLQKV